MDIELTKAIAVLRDQLVEAAEAGHSERLKFGVSEINLEFEIELRASAEAQTGFKAWLISADAKAKFERDRTHRVGITIFPQFDGARLEVAADKRGSKDKFGPS
jgi:hypothetical protein